MRLVRISGRPGDGARYYAARIVAAEVADGRHVAWVSPFGDPPGVAGVLLVRRVEDSPTDIDLLVLDDVPDGDAIASTWPGPAVLVVSLREPA